MGPKRDITAEQKKAFEAVGMKFITTSHRAQNARYYPSLAGSDRKVVVHVQPDATDGERFWCERAASGAPVASWADLRRQDRVVIGGER